MQQRVIEKFNAGSAQNDAAFERAEQAGFPWVYFWERAHAKARESGFLPDAGYLIIDGRYVNSADRVVKDFMASLETVPDTMTLAGPCEPWNLPTFQEWQKALCSMSCMLFEAGVAAAFTHGPADKEDPIARNGGWSIFGDVGFLGLHGKVQRLVSEVGGQDAVELMAEVGDCACVHIYADKLNNERVFKQNVVMREVYVRNACKAAYLAGAVFAGKIQANQDRRI